MAQTNYVCFQCDEEQTFDFTRNSSGAQIEYSYDQTTWLKYTTTVTFGGTDQEENPILLYIRGKNPNGTALEYNSKKETPSETYNTMSKYARIRFGIPIDRENLSGKIELNEASVHISGDIRTLIDWENYQTCNTSNARFTSLFEYNYQIVSVSEDFLPIVDLTSRCYMRMFSQCSRLASAPSLPARNMTRECYREMFMCCTSLQTPPELPAGTDNEQLEYGCYYKMFYSCSSLTQSPVLRANKLADYCYGYMFSQCKSLNQVKMLAENAKEENMFHWLDNTQPVGTFTMSVNASWKIYGYSGIPEEWTIYRE